MGFRTDMAAEMDRKYGKWLSDRDVRREEKTVNGTALSLVEIKSRRAEQMLGKPRGIYWTAEFSALSDDEAALEQAALTVSDLLYGMLPNQGTILVVGLGNAGITPDALGPLTASMVLATRRLRRADALPRDFADLRPVAVITPGVLGKTGVESAETVRGIAAAIRPSAVIAVDALAAGEPGRLGCTVQVGNRGISPGSGVGNHRLGITEETLGIPVIAIGVPTIAEARVITGRPHDKEGAVMVTPREIDLLIDRASRLVAMIINGALFPAYSPAKITMLAR